MKPITTIIIMVLIMFTGCAGSPPVVRQADDALERHSAEFRREVIRVTDGVYVAVGYGLANSILLVGKGGNVIVDTMETLEESARVRRAFEKISEQPVRALIYTHNHTDHVMGSGTWSDSHPRVIAHASTNRFINRVVSQLRPVIGVRAMRMFGTALAPEEVINAGIGPFLGFGATSTVGILRPTETFEDSLDVEIAGLKLHLEHAPGETDDQIFVWLPDKRVVLSGDNLYRSFPNLYTIRGTPYRSPEKWFRSLDRIASLRPAFLVPSHGRPLTGEKNIQRTIEKYRDGIQYLYDQTVRLINMGYTPDEIVATLRLPPELAKDPYLQPFYGKVSWSARAVFAGLLGWFDGDAAHLQPLAPAAHAKLMADLAGGAERLLEAARQRLAAGELQAALELSGDLLRLKDVDHDAVVAVRTEALRRLAAREQNANARHWYLSEALELERGEPLRESARPDTATVRSFPLSVFFNTLRINLDPEAAAGVSETAVFRFPDAGEVWSVTVRNRIAVVRPKAMPDAEIDTEIDSGIFKEMLAQSRNPVGALLKFKLKRGNKIALGRFLARFRPAPMKLPEMPAR